MKITIDVYLWSKLKENKGKISTIHHLELNENDILEFARQKYIDETNEYIYNEYDLEFNIDKVEI